MDLSFMSNESGSIRSSPHSNLFSYTRRYSKVPSNYQKLLKPMRFQSSRYSPVCPLRVGNRFSLFTKPLVSPLIVQEEDCTKGGRSLMGSESTCEGQLELPSFEIQLEGLAPELFTTEIDPFFICQRCKKVARKPKECSACENLSCASCLFSGCPHGCKNFEVKKPCRFARKVYKQMEMKCLNHHRGCRFSGLINALQLHQCKFKELSCRNLICHNKVTQKEHFCSELCRETVSLRENILRSNEETVLGFCRDIVKDKILVRRSRSQYNRAYKKFKSET